MGQSIRVHGKNLYEFTRLHRESFEMHRVVTNLALKEAIEDYLAQHPWAVEDWI